MLTRTAGELYYHRTVTVLGLGLLCFFLFLTLMSVLVSFLAALLAVLPISAVAAKVTYQLCYGALYLAAFLLPIPIMRLLAHGFGIPWQTAYTDRPVSRALPLIVLGGITLIVAQSYLNAWLVSALDFGELFEDMLPTTNGYTTDLDLLLTFIVLAVVPAFCEEMLFRGAILTGLLPFGQPTAILVSALAFALMHQNVAQFLYAFCAGLLLGALYAHSGSIWNCVILHLCNNAYSLLSTALAQRLGAERGELAQILADAALFLAGLASLAILTLRSRERDGLREGTFGRSLPPSEQYAEVRLKPDRAVRLLVASPMGIFLLSCVLTAILSALMLLTAGAFV